MIQRTLEALERKGPGEALCGLDENGQLVWRASGSGLLERVGAWQKHLHQQGVQRGDRVAIDLPRGEDLVAAHLATLASGATVVPLNPALAKPERARLLERAELRTVLSQVIPRGGSENIRLAAGDVVSVEETPTTFVVGTIREFVGFGFSAAIPGL